MKIKWEKQHQVFGLGIAFHRNRMIVDYFRRWSVYMYGFEIVIGNRVLAILWHKDKNITPEERGGSNKSGPLAKRNFF
jgi:hypothetical protein